MCIKKGGCILINKKSKKIALVHRTRLNDYSFPKGHLENNETLKECALRETEEETGRRCHILLENEIGILDYVNKKEGHVEVYFYLAEDDGITQRKIKEEDKEISEWFNLDEVYDKLTYNNLKEFYLKIEQIIKQEMDI